MNFLIINGPNLNMLGIREPDIYGRTTYEDLCNMCIKKGEEVGVNIKMLQSNHEGDLVDYIQQAYKVYDGIIINPGAYTHTSVAILDAAKAVSIPMIEVHISNTDERDEFRKISYIRLACFKTIQGHGLNGYLEAIDEMKKYLGD